MQERERFFVCRAERAECRADLARQVACLGVAIEQQITFDNDPVDLGRVAG